MDAANVSLSSKITCTEAVQLKWESDRGRVGAREESHDEFIFSILVKNGKFYALAEQIQTCLRLHNLCN